jgi:hypothetical protein
VALLVCFALLLAAAGGALAWLNWGQAGQNQIDQAPTTSAPSSSPTLAPVPRPEIATAPTAIPRASESPNPGLKKEEPLASASPSAPASAAELTIRSSPNCAVLLNGQLRGETNHDGILNLPGLEAGSHSLIVRKAGHRDEQQTINLVAGQSNLVNIPLTPLLDSPSAPTPKVRVRPTEPANTVAPREPASSEETLNSIEQDFLNRNYSRVIAACLNILRRQPEQPKANLLLGQSYYNMGQYADSVEPLVKAVKRGERVILRIKHHHREPFGLDDALCSGTLTLYNGLFEFRSADRGGDDFSVPFSMITELKPEAYKGGRLHVAIARQKGSKDYNFHVMRTGLRNINTNSKSPYYKVYCDNCEQEVAALYQLLQQLKQ